MRRLAAEPNGTLVAVDTPSDENPEYAVAVVKIYEGNKPAPNAYVFEGTNKIVTSQRVRSDGATMLPAGFTAS